MSWSDNVRERAHILHQQIATVRAWSIDAGANDTDIEGLVAPYYQLLGDLYEQDFPLAVAADNSDLVVRAEGPAVDAGAPSLSLVTNLFGEFRKEVHRITKSIVGLSDRRYFRLPPEFDLRLGGVAKGSLIMGFKVGRPLGDERGDNLLLFGPEDPLYIGVRDAVRDLASVTRFISDEGVSEEINEQFPDPGVRDTVLVSAHRIAPNGRRGITAISLYGPKTVEGSPGVLTTISKQVLFRSLSHPEKVSGTGTFSGTVREIDLDARRFEIRGEAGALVIRCVYANETSARAHHILNKKVSVHGKYENSKDGRPRLLFVERLEVIEAAPAENQTTF